MKEIKMQKEAVKKMIGKLPFKGMAEKLGAKNSLFLKIVPYANYAALGVVVLAITVACILGASSSRIKIAGQWQSSDGKNFEIKKNKMVIDSVEYPAEIHKKDGEWIVTVYKDSVELRFVGRLGTDGNMELVTPYGENQNLTAK